MAGCVESLSPYKKRVMMVHPDEKWDPTNSGINGGIAGNVFERTANEGKDGKKAGPSSTCACRCTVYREWS